MPVVARALAARRLAECEPLAEVVLAATSAVAGPCLVTDISHLAQKLGRELRVETRHVVDAPDRVAAAVDALWGRFRSRLFSAWLELWVAARTDSALHAEVAVLEERIRQAIATQVHHLFGEGGADAGTADQAYRATIYLMQGMALERSVGTADERTQRQSQAAALDLWKRVLTDVLRPSR